ncbi:DUF3872 domain-containing protein [Niabella beijingensis]|uniref:DUF3872 domain-containing protein n=1 Tax=Niabella beijingensis TaxID=2872700 RepID=UPI001CBD8C05|nr:DUF3872 domain-containing protein [Niabella beijingensis]MBZ4192027.1 DUF3872 domain-containing protein [Niabella beijingensis]
MKRLLNKSKFLWMLVAVMTSAIMLSSCNKDELDIQQNYPFEVKVMPVPKGITNGQTVEIRITIQRSGDFKDANYFICYFQYDGQGTLRYYNDAPYMPNDLYPLPQTQFRLYYTSQSTVSQSFDIWISDNFGNEQQVSFEFNSSD